MNGGVSDCSYPLVRNAADADQHVAALIPVRPRGGVRVGASESRSPYRTLLETMSSGLNGDIHFDLDEVDEIFETMEDTSPWDIFADPWSFYSHEQIQQRQERWTSDDDDSDFDNDPALFADEEYDYKPGTYIREISKIGRNDPCPCGSGKKYKKCCLAVESR